MPTRRELLAAVDASPAAVAEHDKDRWLSLFAPSAIVNDPVGSAPHRGRAQLSRFYDTFIAPNDITFQVHQDIVCGSTVLRDVTLKIQMSDRVTLSVPAHLRYAMTADARIDGLYAHWELVPMVGQLIGKGLPAAAVSRRLTVGLLRNQRLAGTAGFARGFVGVGGRTKRRAAELLSALAAGDSANAAAVLAESAALRFGVDDVHSPAEFGEHLAGWRVGKIIAAGHTVSATLTDGRSYALAMLEYAGCTVSSMSVFVDR
ncbi:nuclear transport factor 2 family protein [Gordonia liuliyuniae]|uniref:Nuclear transport factor 2 family protein n=1 Tax=Gordonia liuliyuniae TaxID=2911517 RepID=A0ABS9IX60_9ACTN|nr:nuclear transport factor 2 family protein [Gordonia liuliyuniae]MCF8590146.1 nuclear transport factor 2 family protein [Gordonia liuliyuniae]